MTMTTEGQAVETEDAPRAKAYTGRKAVCPHCSEEILVHFSVEISEVAAPKGETPSANPADKIARWRSTLDPSQSGTIDAAKRSGLLDSFEQAVKSSAVTQPSNIEKFFLDWLKLARAKMIPSWAMDEFKDLYPGKYIEFHVSQCVGAVVAGGKISLFLPVELLSGKTVKTAMDGTKRMLPPDISGVRQWMRTKMGYVPADCPSAIAEMRKRSFGEFARPVL
jgi:hypothetical protein